MRHAARFMIATVVAMTAGQLVFAAETGGVVASVKNNELSIKPDAKFKPSIGDRIRITVKLPDVGEAVVATVVVTRIDNNRVYTRVEKATGQVKIGQIVRAESTTTEPPVPPDPVRYLRVKAAAARAGQSDQPRGCGGTDLTSQRPADVCSIYRAACLIVWHDDKNFARLERGSSHTTSHFWFHKAYDQGKAAFVKHGTVRPTGASWLRIERKQGFLRCWYRQEGDKEWTAVPAYRLPLPDEVRVGVSLINTTSEPFTVRFEDLVVE